MAKIKWTGSNIKDLDNIPGDKVIKTDGTLIVDNKTTYNKGDIISDG